MIINIQRPTPAGLLKIREGTTVISLLYPLTNLDLVSTLDTRKITVIAVDSIPLAALAQMMVFGDAKQALTKMVQALKS